MATQINPRPPNSDPIADRSHVVYARHQWFGMALFLSLIHI